MKNAYTSARGVTNHTRANTYKKPNPYGNKSSTGKKFGLNRALLPTPLFYYTETMGMKLLKGAEWRLTLCKFHDEKTPSLSINTVSGGFNCFTCGAKGGDIIAFHMAHTGLPFIDTCKALGAWEGK